MQYIDEKFKDRNPADTVALIQSILENLGVETVEYWNESGVENCHSLNLCAKAGAPSSNGKGVTREFARASAYAEFIERLQGGLHFYKNQSIIRDPELNIHAYAPDARYMTEKELVENGEWMDYLIEKATTPGVTRESIAQKCRVFACADEDSILTLPFYSLFEDKYVYLPIAFVDQVYASNGCCAGNTREEAWVHAFSEILERNASVSTLMGGGAVPRIPEEVIEKFPVVKKILKEVREKGDFDIEIFDLSGGNGYPVVSTRIINKKTHSYQVNVAGDPVLEIALQRTLTELMQGRNVSRLASRHDGRILGKVSSAAATSNVINQLETGNGYFFADYFANEITCDKVSVGFDDNSNKSNKELLDYALNVYRKIGKPVYVRNFSYLGFPSYRFVIPGFSEAFIGKAFEPISEYGIAESVRGVFLDAASADNSDLNMFLFYNNMVSKIYGRYNMFGRLAGIPMAGNTNVLLAAITRAYAAYRLGKLSDAVKFTNDYLRGGSDEEIKEYFRCVNKYIELKSAGVSEDKIRVILPKFFSKEYPEKLFSALDKGLTPYDDYLLRCDFKSCQDCKYKDACAYQSSKDMVVAAGKVLSAYHDGQKAEEFKI